MRRDALQPTDETLPDRVELWAKLKPEAAALIFLADGERESERLSFADLQRDACKVAARLRALGATGHPVLLMFPPGLAFVAAFFGCLRAGAIAVPVPWLGGSRGARRLAAIAADARPRAVLTSAAVATAGQLETAPALEGIAVIVTESLPLERDADRAAVAPHSVALLQYTSGSTSEPKGVAITHAALMTNLDMLRAAMQVEADSVYVSWLPLFHDMGLIAIVLEALYAGALTVLMPPLAFLQQPGRWLAAIDCYRGTISGAPNFAFDLCARRVGAGAEPGALDLSSWRVAFCAAEPVRAETLHRFAQAFAPHGFRADALYPAYGLAEATVFVSGGDVGAGVRTLTCPDAADRSRSASGAGRRIASCGRPCGDETIAIVDPDTGEECAEGEVGEIWVSGSHVAAGYWRNPGATAETFGARLGARPEQVYLRTGDLGFMREGELYVAGRIKDLLIVNGASLHPQDVEDAIAGSHPAFAARGAAFSIEGPGGESVVAAHEITRTAMSMDLSAAVAAGFTAAGQETGVRLFDLVLIRPGGIPVTTSGKVRRKKCRELYRSGALPVMPAGADHPWLGKCRP